MLVKIVLSVTKIAPVTSLTTYGSTPEDPVPAPTVTYIPKGCTLPMLVLGLPY
jgi:hypothetical protein